VVVTATIGWSRDDENTTSPGWIGAPGGAPVTRVGTGERYDASCSSPYRGAPAEVKGGFEFSPPTNLSLSRLRLRVGESAFAFD